MPDAASFDKAAQVWTLPWEDDWVTAVAFAGASRRLAVGNNLGKVLLYDLPEKAGGAAPAPVRRLDGHTNTISRLLTTADGRWLISASYDHSIRLWDLQAPASGQDTVILDARARAAAAKKAGGKAPLDAPGVKVEVQQAQHTLAGHRDWVLNLALSRDGKLLLSGDDTGVVIVWDLEARKELRRWQLKGWAYAMALSPDSKQALVSERIPLVFDSGRLAAAKIWDVATGQMVRDLAATLTKEAKEYVAAAAYSPDGKLLALGQGGETSGNGKIHILEAGAGKKLREMPGHQYGVTDLVFTADGKFLLTSGRDTLVKVWQTADGKLVKDLGKPRGGQFKDWIHAIALTTDERWLAAADMAGAVQVWSLGG
jgi:WD40 repeat protein